MLNEKSNGTFKETVSVIAGILLYGIFVLGGILLLLMLIKGTPWISKNVYPIMLSVATITTVTIVPISIILAIFKKTRAIGGAGFLATSYVVGISTWTWSLLVAYTLAGTFWLIFGLILGGVGVIPISIIAAFLKGNYSIVGNIIFNLVVIYGLRFIGMLLISKAEN